MAEYKLQKGIYLTEICGVFLLVADADARKKLPYITKINELGAAVIELIGEGKSKNEIEIYLSSEYDLENKNLSEKLDEFIEILNQNHYIISEDV